MDPPREFCPLCGTDNRDPFLRKAVPQHVHLYVGEMFFCVLCGAAKDRIFDLARIPRIVIGGFLTAAGIVSLLAAGLIQLGHADRNSFLGRVVGGWYEIQEPIRYAQGTSRTVDRGLNMTLFLVMVGATCLFFGALVLTNRQSLASSKAMPVDD